MLQTAPSLKSGISSNLADFKSDAVRRWVNSPTTLLHHPVAPGAQQQEGVETLFVYNKHHQQNITNINNNNNIDDSSLNFCWTTKNRKPIAKAPHLLQQQDPSPAPHPTASELPNPQQPINIKTMPMLLQQHHPSHVILATGHAGETAPGGDQPLDFTMSKFKTKTSHHHHHHHAGHRNHQLKHDFDITYQQAAQQHMMLLQQQQQQQLHNHNHIQNNTNGGSLGSNNILGGGGGVYYTSRSNSNNNNNNKSFTTGGSSSPSSNSMSSGADEDEDGVGPPPPATAATSASANTGVADSPKDADGDCGSLPPSGSPSPIIAASKNEGHVLEFVVEPSDTIVEAGQSAVLDCVVKAAHHQESVYIQWLDQDRHQIIFASDTYRSQLTNGSIYINSVIEEQRLTGNYQCMATLPNVGSIISRIARLDVARLSGFHEEPRDISVYVGQKAYFACHINAAPPPKIRWLKDERPIQIDELRMTVLPSGALEIDEVIESDQGSYRCNASGLNSYKLSNKATLIVIEDHDQAAHVAPPTFIAQPRPPTTIVEGQNMSLDCAANGNPNPTITWLKDGYAIDMNFLDSRFSLVGSTSSLRITNIKEEDTGTYQCRAENREDSLDASAVVTVQVPPKFLTKPQDKTEMANKDVELECSVYGIPEPKIQWFKDGDIITFNDYYQLVNGHNLKIMGLMLGDSGLFQCFATNAAGNIQAAASLKVLNPADSTLVHQRTGQQEGLPGPPQDLKAPIVKARFVILSWKAPQLHGENVQTYTVYYRQEGSERERVQNTSRSRLEEISIGGLTPNRVYHFRVVGINSAGMGQSSESLTVTTQSEEHVASAPVNFVAYATSPRSIHVSYRPPETPNGVILRYTVYYMETSSSIEHNIDTTDLKFDLVGLSIYTEYSIWVVAVNENGPGAATEEKVVRTLSAPPSEPPYNVTLEPSSTSIIVRWEPPPPEYQNGVITGYKLRYRKQGKKGLMITTAANERWYILKDLDRGSVYQVKLMAINVNGTGPSTEWYEVETYQNDLDESRVPDEPGPLRVRPTFDKLYVLWTPPTNQNIRVRNYILGWGKGIPDMFTQELDEKTRSYIIERLEPNSEYVLSLRASNEMGAGPPVYTTVRTQDEPPPEPQPPLIPPVGLKAQVLSSTSVVLYWTDTTLSKSQYVRDNRHYVVKYTAVTSEKNLKNRFLNVSDLNVMIDDLKPNTLYEFTVKLVKGYVIMYTDNKTKHDREWLVQAIKGDKHSSVLSDLQPNTEYFFKVQARNSRGYGPYSNVVIFTTGQDVGKLAASSGQSVEGKGLFSDSIMLYILIGGCAVAVTTIALVTAILCCRRRDTTITGTSPDRNKKGYQKGATTPSCKQPPDLWIHHDQMELKNLEKSQSSNTDGASSSGGGGATTLPRSMGGGGDRNEYDAHDSHLHHGHHSGSLDKRTYVPNYVGVSPPDEHYHSLHRKRPTMKTKPIISLPVDSKPPREPIATPINTTSLSQSSSDSTPSSRPSYPRTQYNMPRAHVTVDSCMSQSSENPYALHAHPPGWIDSHPGHISQPPPAAHIPPGSAYAPGMSVLAESQAGSTSSKRLQPLASAQGQQQQQHPLKSFTVPAPPPISAPGTPQAKHIVTVRPNSSPFKKPPISAVAANNTGAASAAATATNSSSSASNNTLNSTSTPPSRINPANPPPHTAEEVQRLQPSHSTEELNQEMANLEGLMLTLNAITANEFEC